MFESGLEFTEVNEFEDNLALWLLAWVDFLYQAGADLKDGWLRPRVSTYVLNIHSNSRLIFPLCFRANMLKSFFSCLLLQSLLTPTCLYDYVHTCTVMYMIPPG